MSPSTTVPDVQRDDALPADTLPEDVEVVESEPPRELPETDVLNDASTDDAPEDDTVLAEDDVEIIEDEAPTADDLHRIERTELAARTRSSRKLPKGLRDRLAEVVETLQLSDDASPTPTVPVAEAVEMIEAAIPENLQFHEGPLETLAHPRGDGFFTGGAAQLSSEDAQRIAKEQLAATGFGTQT